MSSGSWCPAVEAAYRLPYTIQETYVEMKRGGRWVCTRGNETCEWSKYTCEKRLERGTAVGRGSGRASACAPAEDGVGGGGEVDTAVRLADEEGVNLHRPVPPRSVAVVVRRSVVGGRGRGGGVGASEERQEALHHRAHVL